MLKTYKCPDIKVEIIKPKDLLTLSPNSQDLLIEDGDWTEGGSL